MADVQTSMYSLANQTNPTEDYQKALTASVDRQAQGMNLSTLANQTTTAGQQFQDQQVQRQALQQNTDQSGNLNKPSAIAQIAKQNPLMAKNLDKMLNQYGIDGAAQHAETMQDFFAHATPQDYAQRKQDLISKGFNEAEGLPEVYVPQVQRQGLLGSASGSQQVEMLKNQASMQNARDLEMIKEGVVPPEHEDNLYNRYGSDKTSGKEENPHLIPANHLPPQAQGLQPGQSIPFGKRDLEAQKMAQADLGARQAGDNYKIANNDLLAAQKVSAVLTPYEKDFSKFPNKLFPSLNAEVAKISGGAAPTAEQLKSMDPNNIPEKWANFKSFITGNPQDMNNAEIVQMYKNYVDDLKQKSMANIATHYKSSEDVGQRAGMSAQTLAALKKSHAEELDHLANGYQSNPQASAHPQDSVAIQWAKQNPGPKADAILKANGVNE